MRNAHGFSIIEALIAGVLVAVAALGLGQSISQLSKTRTKSQLVSTAISLESSLIASLQSPSTYNSYKSSLQSGQIPSDMVIPIPFDDNSLSIRPGQTLYLTRQLQLCPRQSFTDTACALMIQLAPMKKIDDHFAFAYSIQGNPQLTTMSALGSPQASDYSVSVPVDIYQNQANDVNCSDRLTDIGIMGMGDNGKPICIKKPNAGDTCPRGTLAKGFKVIFDSGSKEYRLAFQCSPPLRILSCIPKSGNPYPGAYSLQSFIPASLDRAAPPSALAGNTCTLIATNPSPYADGSGAFRVLTQRDGVQVTNACPAGYKPQVVRCDISSLGGQDVICRSGLRLTHVKPTKAQGSVQGNNVACQVVVPAQPFCSNSPGDPNYQTKAWANANLSYQCVLDGSAPETLQATAN
jgi:hypothetical protein